MDSKNIKWEILDKTKNRKSEIKIDGILNILLANRGLKTKKQREEFFSPQNPEKLNIEELGIDTVMLKKAVKRIRKAKELDEQIIIYGDYDADGICATAILWETLYSLTKKVSPYIPDRFEEGYGINGKSIEKIKIENPDVKLIITVDNGIVAHEALDKANDLGIDVIVTDHHQKEKRLPKAYAIIHTDKISGAGISWILAREIKIRFRIQDFGFKNNDLELAAIGTIADQMPLVDANRSFAKYGLEALNKTERSGLLALFEEAAIKKGSLGTYEVNFVIAPRLNAMGRLEHAIESLRLLCTTNHNKARELAFYLGKTNRKRQKIVDEIVLHAHKEAKKRIWKGVILVSHKSYHEGVIGLAASKLVEEFWRPAIVLSEGKKISKASARSISDFNIIESIRKLNELILGGGGHPMAAGFSIETTKIKAFKNKLDKISAPLLTDLVLARRIKVDTEIGFEDINIDLLKELEKFEPAGIGNPTPIFLTKKVNIMDVRTVGVNGKHLKLVLEKDGLTYGAIAFNKGEFIKKLKVRSKIDIVYNLISDDWNGKDKLQLKIKDIKISNKVDGKN